MSPITCHRGVGKIVRDQHLPALAKNAGLPPDRSREPPWTVDAIDNFKSIEAMLEAVPGVEAVSLCMAAAIPLRGARTALAAGKHVFLEKPAARL